jgi:hypothetical protein
MLAGLDRMSLPMRHAEQGLTLTEILVASALSLMVIFGITTMDTTRTRIYELLRVRSGAVSEEGAAALAMLSLQKHLEVADRVYVLSAADPGNIQIRVPFGCAGAAVPAPACFDVATSYQWDQFRRTGDEMRLYTNTGAGCGTLRVLARSISALTFQYTDQAPKPPGTEPANNDNNLLEFSLTWDNLFGRTHRFQDKVTIRAGAYTDIATGLQDPLAADMSPPPAACP